jgi:hypothetical protein
LSGTVLLSIRIARDGTHVNAVGEDGHGFALLAAEARALAGVLRRVGVVECGDVESSVREAAVQDGGDGGGRSGENGNSSEETHGSDGEWG